MLKEKLLNKSKIGNCFDDNLCDSVIEIGNGRSTKKPVINNRF